MREGFHPRPGRTRSPARADVYVSPAPLIVSPARITRRYPVGVPTEYPRPGDSL